MVALPDDAEDDHDDAANEACADHGQRAVSHCGELTGRLFGVANAKRGSLFMAVSLVLNKNHHKGACPLCGGEERAAPFGNSAGWRYH